MALKKTISIRVTEEFHQKFGETAAKITEMSGKRVDMTDLFWRIYDLGFPLLEQELRAENVDVDRHLSDKLASARRIAKNLYQHLQAV